MKREDQPELLPIGVDGVKVVKDRLEELGQQVERFGMLSEGMQKPSV
jgi:hypothetical protein